MLQKTGLQTLSLTIPWSQPNLLNFLRRSHGQPRFFWESRREPISIAGFGTAAIFRAAGPRRFSEIRKQVADFFAGLGRVSDSHAPTGLPEPCIFGGFAFQSGSQDPANPASGIWQGFGDACFIAPKYQLLRYEGRSWLTVTANVDAEGEYAAQDALWDLPAMLDVPPAAPHLGVAQPASLMAKDAWIDLVRLAKLGIESGDFQKVVIARALDFRLPVDPLRALSQLSGRFPDCYRFLFEPEPGRAFFGASPELLGNLFGERLLTMALAGSAPRGSSLEEDESFGTALLESKKDLIEHRYVIEDIRTNLAALLPDVRVGKTGLLQLSNIQHLHTPISAGPLDGLDMVDLIEALHPTPAVGGLPRRPANHFICEHEPVSRGWYAAPVGWLNANGQGTFAVGLRSAVTNGSATRLYAGAGIVADSEPEKEWTETEMKFIPILDATR